MSSCSGTIATIVIDAEDRHAERAADVANRGPGRQRAERADLGDVRLAVLLLDVLDHLAAAVLAEVDVDIGRFAAVLVEEPLEQQVVLQRADVAQIRARSTPASRRRCRGPWPECRCSRA